MPCSNRSPLSYHHLCNNRYGYPIRCGTCHQCGATMPCTSRHATMPCSESQAPPQGQGGSVEPQGVSADGQAGELQTHSVVASSGVAVGDVLAPAISNVALSASTLLALRGGLGPTSTAVASADARFEALQTRVALLEAGLAELRGDDRQIGPGHNKGPAFTPVEDLSEVDDWILALLKEKGPSPPADPTSLIEKGEKALRISERISNAVMTLGAEMAKGGAREAGKELFTWIGVGQLIKDLFLALIDWLKG